MVILYKIVNQSQIVF